MLDLVGSHDGLFALGVVGARPTPKAEGKINVGTCTL